MKPIKPQSLNKAVKQMSALIAKMQGLTKQTQLKIEEIKP